MNDMYIVVFLGLIWRRAYLGVNRQHWCIVVVSFFFISLGFVCPALYINLVVGWVSFVLV